MSDKLSRDEILSMEAGRETDKLIGKLLFGWTWDGTSARPPNGGHCAMIPEDPFWWLPFYSTDIAAAWQVVEKLKPAHFDLEQDWDQAWYCTFATKEQQPFSAKRTGCASTPELAICRAALLAVMEAT